jgi:hypothetical protein
MSIIPVKAMKPRWKIHSVAADPVPLVYKFHGFLLRIYLSSAKINALFLLTH